MTSHANRTASGWVSHFAARAKTVEPNTAAMRYRIAAARALDDDFGGEAEVFALLAISAAIENAAMICRPIAPDDDA